MNPELPPLPFSAPQTRRRRQQRKSAPPYIPIPSEQRREIAQRVLHEVTAVRQAFTTLSPEQRRAVILKLKHDRYLTFKDLAGTDLRFIGEPGEGNRPQIARNVNQGSKNRNR